MANNLNANPLVIDTAASSPAVWLASPASISRFRLVGASAGASICVVKDGAGHVIHEVSVGTANQVDDCEFHEPLQVKGGVFVTTLTSGKLYIYIAPYR